MSTLFANTNKVFKKLYDDAEAGTKYDMLLKPGNKEGEKTLTGLVNALSAQTRGIEEVVAALKVEKIAIEGSDSLDNPEAVMK